MVNYWSMMVTLLILLIFSVLSTEAQDCGTPVFIDSYGFIPSPNYPDNYVNNLDCTYTIYAPLGSSYSLIFLDFSTEVSYDRLTISCSTNDSFVAQVYSGSDPPDPFSVPWCTQAQLRLTTDQDATDRGFHIEYFVSVGGCGNTVFTDASGNITSPGYPSNYGNNQNCSFMIQAAAATNMTISFQEFSLQNCANCSCDFVQVTCLDDNTDYGRYCGSTVPPDIDIEDCQTVLVLFRSDGSTIDIGFNAEYIFVLPSFGPCGQIHFTNPTGIISSPNNPGYYGTNLRCYYTIFATADSRHTLTIQAVIIDNHFDQLDVYCATNGSVPRTRYQGTTHPPANIIPWCSKVQFLFSTGLYNTTNIGYTGFNLSYVVSPTSDGYGEYCGTVLDYVNTNGLIRSPNFSQNYYNNLRCNYTIESLPDSSHTLTFLNFTVELNYDYVDVRCASNTTFSVTRYTGYDIPAPVSIPWCSNAQIYFYTDKSVVYPGFSISYQVSTGGCGDTVFSGFNGTISSPSYPSNYANNQNCSYTIWAPQLSLVNVVFTQFSLQACDNCTCDWVEIRCLDDDSLYGRFCDSTIPDQMTMKCTHALVWFSSNDNSTYPGFQLQYIQAEISSNDRD